MRRSPIPCDPTRLLMHIRVEFRVARDARTAPLRTAYLNGRRVEIAETIDQWHGPDYRYVKVSDRAGNLYIFRQDEVCAAWELTMFKSARAQALSGRGN